MKAAIGGGKWSEVMVPLVNGKEWWVCRLTVLSNSSRFWCPLCGWIIGPVIEKSTSINKVFKR